MSIRRVLINLDRHNVDFRLGLDALDELPHMLPVIVGKPKRALLLTTQDQPAQRIECVQHALAHCNFEYEIVILPSDIDLKKYSSLSFVYNKFAESHLTRDDCVIGLGDYSLTSVVSCAAASWLGSIACVLLPTTLQAAILCPTFAQDFELDSSDIQLVHINPHVNMVVCDLTIIKQQTQEENMLGWLLILIGAMTDGRAAWNRFTNSLVSALRGENIALRDLISVGVHAYRDIVMARNPSARAASDYGFTTARALQKLMDFNVPWYHLLAEGIRFESRLATDVQKFDVDAVFEQEDCLDLIGIPELGFSLNTDVFIQALKNVCFARQNRFLMPLPKTLGTVRLSMASDELLYKHAQAYLLSRQDLLSNNE